MFFKSIIAFCGTLGKSQSSLNVVKSLNIIDKLKKPSSSSLVKNVSNFENSHVLTFENSLNLNTKKIFNYENCINMCNISNVNQSWSNNSLPMLKMNSAMPNLFSFQLRNYSTNKPPPIHPLKSTISSLQAKKRVVRKKRLVEEGTEQDDDKYNDFYSSVPHQFVTFDSDLRLPSPPIPKKVHKREWQVTAYATADEYKLEALLEALNEQGLYMKANQQKSAQDEEGFEYVDMNNNSALDPMEVLHVVERYHISNEQREIYFFRDGATIFWNVPQIERENLLRFISHFETHSYALDIVKEECESLSYSYSETKTRIVRDSIILNTEGNTELEKYTFSNALCMSVKLGIWEESLEKYIDRIEYVVEELSSTGRVVLSQEQVLQKMGQLFALRHMLNLGSDLLDIPDFYWDHPHLEQLYKRTCNLLSLTKRTSVMNEKINHCLELMELLKSHLGEKHSARLEWIIIILIVIEVIFEMLHFL